MAEATVSAGRLEQSRKVLRNILSGHSGPGNGSTTAVTSSRDLVTSFKDGHRTLILYDVNKLHSPSTPALLPSPPPDASRYRATNAVTEFHSPSPTSPLLVRKIVLPPLRSSHSPVSHSALLSPSDAAAASLLMRQYPRPSANAQKTRASSLDMQGRASLRERLLQRELRRSLTITWPSRTAASRVRPRTIQDDIINNDINKNKHSSNSNYNSLINANNNNSANLTNNMLVSKDLEDADVMSQNVRTAQGGARGGGAGKHRIQIVYQRSPTTMITQEAGANAAITSSVAVDDKCWPADKSSYLKQLEQETLSGDEKTKLWLLTNPVEQVALTEPVPGFGERDLANRRVMFTEQQPQ